MTRFLAAARLLPLLMMLLLIGAAPSRAHGPTPAVLGVAAMDNAGPTVVRLSEGLAHTVGDRWEYLCPAAWGGLATPLTASSATKTTIIGDGPLIRGPQGDLTRYAFGPTKTNGLGTASWAGFGWISARSEMGGTELWRASDNIELFLTDAGAWGAPVATESALYLSRLDEGALEVAALTGPVDSPEVPAPVEADEAWETWKPALNIPEGASVTLRATPHALYARLTPDAGGFIAFWQLTSGPTRLPTPIELWSGEDVTAGPLEVLLDHWFVQDGRLVRPDGAEPYATPPRFTCAHHFGDASYICQFTRVRAFDLETGALGSPVFALTDLHPPRAAMAYMTAQGMDTGSCVAEWLDFALDGGLPTEGPPVIPPTPPTPESSGCSGGPAKAPWGLWTLMVLAIRRSIRLQLQR